MSGKIINFYKEKNKTIKGFFQFLILFIMIPYIEIIIKSIYTVGTIIGTYTRLNS